MDISISFPFLILSLMALLVMIWLVTARHTSKRLVTNPVGQCFLITGAAGGVGRCVASRLSELGCTVFAADLNLEALQKLYSKHQNVITLELDVTNSAQVESCASSISAHCSKLHGVINCAGIAFSPKHPKGVIQGLIELDVDNSILPVLNVNLLGPLRVNHAMFPLLWEAKGSTIINIASIAGRVATPGLGPYATSKFGLIGYTDALRRELAPYKIRVVCLEPGFLNTDMTSTIFSSATLDTSQTRLFAGRGDESAGGSQNKPRDLPDASIVSAEIEKILFYENQSIPHRVVDNLSNSLIWKLAMNLPHNWVDKILEMGSKRQQIVEERFRQSDDKTKSC